MKSKITPETLTELCEWLRLPFMVVWSNEISGLVEVLYVPFKEPGYDGDVKSAREWLKRNRGRSGITAPLREAAEYLFAAAPTAL